MAETQIEMNGLKQFLEDNPTICSDFQKLIRQKSSVTPSSRDPGQKSEQLRNEANALYRKRQLIRARSMYTESIKTAPFHSEQESLAFGNRSAVSYELKNYQECLADIENALPITSKRKKLLLRKVTCLVALDELDKAAQVRAEINAMDENTKEVTPSEPDVPIQRVELSQKEEAVEHIALYKNPHSKLESASEVLRCESSPSRGRFIKVDCEVPKGSVLIKERPYTHVLLPDYWPTHCYRCLKDKCSNTPVLRRDCGVIYCSSICENAAWTLYHQYECSLLPVIVNTGIGHLAYRIVTQTGCHTLTAHRASLNRSEPCLPLSSYDAVYHLVTNEKHIVPDDYYHYSKTAVLLLFCALHSNFFGDSHSLQILDEDALYIGSLLLRHICQLICNAHAITIVSSNHEGDSPILEENQTKLATAVYPTASLLNHSCKPNISVSFVGPLLIVKNSTDLKPGDQVYNCYGPHYLKMSKRERLEALKSQYYFSCDCEACQEETSEPEPYKLNKALRCVYCDGAAVPSSETTAQCTQCSKTYDSRSQLESVYTARHMMASYSDTSNPAEGIAVAQRCYSILKNTVYKYNMDLANAKDMEAKCHAATGDMKLCAECLLESISILKHVYNTDSVELAHEYFKLSEVLTNSGDHKEALKYAMKARTIFIRQYSQGHSHVTAVQNLIRQLEEVNL